MSDPSPQKKARVEGATTGTLATSTSSSTTTNGATRAIGTGPRALLHRRDLWVDHILPFLGVGYYVFVAGVNKQLKMFYEAYVARFQRPRLTYCLLPDNYVKVTTFQIAFSSVSGAEYWARDNSEYVDRVHVDGVGMVPFAFPPPPHSVGTLACNMAASNGNILVLKWAMRLHYTWDCGTCASAAKTGQLQMLKFLHENGCPWDEWTCHNAARFGHMEVLVYARRMGCPWDKYTIQEAARGGHLDIVVWAKENGCSWDAYLCMDACMDL